MFQLVQAGVRPVHPVRPRVSSSLSQRSNSFYNDLFYAQQLGSLCININLKESVFIQPCQILSQDGELILELRNDWWDILFNGGKLFELYEDMLSTAVREQGRPERSDTALFSQSRARTSTENRWKLRRSVYLRKQLVHFH